MGQKPSTDAVPTTTSPSRRPSLLGSIPTFSAASEPAANDFKPPSPRSVLSRLDVPVDLSPSRLGLASSSWSGEFGGDSRTASGISEETRSKNWGRHSMFDGPVYRSSDVISEGPALQTRSPSEVGQNADRVQSCNMRSHEAHAAIVKANVNLNNLQQNQPGAKKGTRVKGTRARSTWIEQWRKWINSRSARHRAEV
ncbi:hypothetical protein T484DRAFT_1929214 [Baffinella frigidus]|nr:hypothetical protein T484DRAFT_1929214 [Cryptophyta sp. CCMP2293]